MRTHKKGNEKSKLQNEKNDGEKDEKQFSECIHYMRAAEKKCNKIFMMQYFSRCSYRTIYIMYNREKR